MISTFARRMRIRIAYYGARWLGGSWTVAPGIVLEGEDLPSRQDLWRAEMQARLRQTL